MEIPRKLESVTIDEKVRYFDCLFNMALQEYCDKEDSTQDDDYPHYIFEAVMEMLAPENEEKAFWSAYNSLPGERG